MLFDKLGRVVLFFSLGDAALKIPIERLLSPGAIDGVTDWREGGDGSVLVSLRGKVQRKRAMAAYKIIVSMQGGNIRLVSNPWNSELETTMTGQSCLHAVPKNRLACEILHVVSSCRYRVQITQKSDIQWAD